MPSVHWLLYQLNIQNVPDAGIVSAQVTLGDLAARRQPFNGTGGTAHVFLELYGAEMMPMSHYEPDPITFRGDYYYNTTINALYRKIVTRNHPEVGLVRAYWKQVSR